MAEAAPELFEDRDYIVFSFSSPGGNMMPGI